VPEGTAPLLLTDLEASAPSPYRLLGQRSVASYARVARHLAAFAREAAAASAIGAADRLLGRERGAIRSIAEGSNPRPGHRSVALYAHFSPTGRVSEMVMAQLRAYAEAGFAVVFVSSAPRLAPADWERVGEVAALRVLRENHALDFGAWQAVAPLAAQRWPRLDELLLANDSVLGPLRPLPPIFAALRAGGAGLFGLTESLQTRPHLQSYFLLARGPAAVADMLGFLQSLRLTLSKRVLIRRAELGLSAWMRARGHRVAALFGYRRVVRRIAHLPVYLDALPPGLVPTGGRPDSAGWERLLLGRRPLNMTHHLWRALVGEFGFPFIKTELVRRNPAGMPDTDAWAAVIGPDSPCPPGMIAAHLTELGG
jgi:hypothetical protein